MPRAVPVERPRHREAAPGECAAPSAPGGSRTGVLARLEPEGAPARLYPARATPTHRDQTVASRCRFATHRGRDPVSRAARALASLLARAARSQCARCNGWASHHQAVRHSSKLCCLAWSGNGVICLDSRWGPSSRTRWLLRAVPHALFFRLLLPSSLLLPVWLSIPLAVPSFMDSPSNSV